MATTDAGTVHSPHLEITQAQMILVSSKMLHSSPSQGTVIFWRPDHDPLDSAGVLYVYANCL